MKSIDKLREAATYNPAFSDNATRIVCNYLSEIEAEIADGYKRLPLDANNVTIHVGDICEMSGVQFKVRQLCTDGNCWWAVDGTGEFYIADLCRHVKPRTLEDVLEDYVVEYQTRHARSEFGAEHFDHVDVHEMIKRCADEIRELLGFEIDEPDTIRNELEDNGELLGGDER